MNNQNEFRKYAVNHLGMSGNALDDYNKKVSSMTPYVIMESNAHFRPVDVFTKLIDDRIIFLGLPIDEYIGNLITAQLLYLETSDKNADILMYINSPGGHITDGLAVYDTMNYIKPDIATLCTGMAASMSAVLLASGTKGKRGALKHSRIMIHQARGGAHGVVSDMKIQLKQAEELQHDLYEILSETTGQSYETIHKDADRDFWMRPQAAKDYGLIDKIYLKNTDN